VERLHQKNCRAARPARNLCPLFYGGSTVEMSTPRENFDAWFVKVLESLYPCRDAGFAILMIVFPLLERYLRQRVGIPSEDQMLSQGPAFDELYNLFPELRDEAHAKDFWQVYRNGLLHQGTFSRRSPAIYGLATHDIPQRIVIDDQNNAFLVHPVLFAKAVVEKIVNDFTTYEGAKSPAPPLSVVQNYPPVIIGTADTVLATGWFSSLNVSLSTSKPADTQ
jgi:hypothetical protein